MMPSASRALASDWIGKKPFLCSLAAQDIGGRRVGTLCRFQETLLR